MLNDRALVKKLTDEWVKQGWTNNDSTALLASQLLVAGNSPRMTASQIPRTFYIANKVKKGDMTTVLTTIIAETRSMVQVVNRLNILFISAGPSDGPRLRLDAELRDVINRIRATSFRDNIKLSIALAVRQSDLMNAFNTYKPGLLHISGHASSTGIVLEDDHGRADFVDIDKLAKIISLAGPQLKLVILNACESANQAKLLTSYVDVVIGMGNSISDDAARAFSVQFYASLGEGVSVKTAFEQAKFAIEIDSLQEGDIPQIYFRSGLEPDSYTLTINPR